ncbi:MAG: hypothetical protein ACM3SW_07855 [Actinomycetota bacterium]
MNVSSVEVFSWTFLAGLVPLTVSFLSGSAIVAFLAFQNQLKLQRIKWLQELYEAFYNSEQHKRVRQQIDFEDVDHLFSLLEKSDKNPQSLNQEERAELDRFTDYLNFFEWIAFLEKKKQFSFDDLDILFKYYLVRLLQVDKSQRFRKYIKDNGYEGLHSLLNHYSAVNG